MPGSQSVLDLLVDHFSANIPQELETYTSILDDSLAFHSPLEERAFRTWGKRILADPVRLTTADVALKISAILDRLPIAHEILNITCSRGDVLSMSALAERASQRCVINITFIQATERLTIHVLVATGIAGSAPWER